MIQIEIALTVIMIFLVFIVIYLITKIEELNLKINILKIDVKYLSQYLSQSDIPKKSTILPRAKLPTNLGCFGDNE